MSDIVIETKVVHDEFMAVHDVYVVHKHAGGTLRIKLARLYLEGMQDAQALVTDLPSDLTNFIEFIKKEIS